MFHECKSVLMPLVFCRCVRNATYEVRTAASAEG